MSGPEELPPGVHPQALLLPWFLAGTLTEFEREAVTAHLATCRSCQLELEAVQNTRRLVREALAAEPAARPDLEARVMQAITREAAAPAAVVNPMRAARLWRLAASVAFATIAVETAMIAFRTEHPLPVAVASRGLAPESLRVELTLQPAATEASMRALFLSLHARIVDGPDASGRYVVEIPSRPGAGADALAVLRQQGGVVRDVRLLR